MGGGGRKCEWFVDGEQSYENSKRAGFFYLHYVFDLWAKRWRGREATGDMIIVPQLAWSCPDAGDRENSYAVQRL
jgi:hypothetical protein